MNLDQLSALPTTFLVALQKDIRLVLQSRRQSEGKQSRRTFIQSLASRPEEQFDDYRRNLIAYNAKELRSLPFLKEPMHTREKYLLSLLGQNWSDCYPETGGPENFYVYAHVDPSERIFVSPSEAGGCYKGSPFYIGKGTKERAWDLKRNEGHGTRLRHLIKQGWKPEDLVHIAFEGLTESKAFELEAKLIYFFGTIYETGRPFGMLLNLAVPRVPNFIREMERMPTRKQYESAKLPATSPNASA